VKKQPKPWLIFSGLFFQIAIVMLVLTRLGKYVDSYFQNESNQVTLIFSLLGITIIIYLIISQTKNLK
tara:strand:+ start:17717 stop:17920 length:204 start_codon:yes stop_codon:yes gene_type:complete